MRLESYGSWQLWLQSLEHVRVAERTLQATGPYVFRYDGGPGEIRFSHNGGGPFAVEALSGQLSTAARLVGGKGTWRVQGLLPGPGLYCVRSYANGDLILLPTAWST